MIDDSGYVRRPPRRRAARLALGACAMLLAVAITSRVLSAQSLLDRPARLVVEHVPLGDALRLLQHNAALSLVFSPDLLPAERVSCDCRARTVEEALSVLLAGTRLTFRATRTQVLIIPRRTLAGTEVGVVVGRIVDGQSDAPVPSVQVRLENGQGVMADESGRFMIRGVHAGTYRLEVTGIGWQPWVGEGVVVPAGDTVSVVVRLRREAVPLPELIVAPGTFGILESVPPGTVRTITRDQIETMPQMGEDVFRSLKRLAGVTAHDISTRLSVRGSLDREVSVRLDGLELYEPYHLKDWDGVFGIVDLAALAGVELKAGGFGVEYGDRGAGVLDMKSRTPIGPAQTMASLNVSHLSLLSQGGFAGDKGSWLVSGREGSLGLLMRMVGADKRLSPQFYDAFGKVTFQPAACQLLAVHVLRAGDNFHLDAGQWDGISVGDGIEAGRIRSDWGSTYGWITWDGRVGERVSAHSHLWTGRVTRLRQGNIEDAGSIGTPEQIAVKDDRSFDVAGLRQEADLEVSRNVMLRLGGEVARTWASYDYFARTATPYLATDGTGRLRIDTLQVAIGPDGDREAAFAAVRGRVGDGLTAEVGVRWDRTSRPEESHVAPRAQASLSLGPSTTLRASVGRYFQSQGIGDLQVGDGQTLYAPAERSDLVALGLEQRLGGRSRLRVEAYDREISDQQPRFIGLQQELEIFPEQQGDRLRIDPGRGRTRGIELFMEGTVGPRWYWSASYALAKAEDELPQTTPCTTGPTCLADPWVPRSRDQRHAVDLQADFRPDDAWHFAAAWTFHTGWPATAWIYGALLKADGSPFFTREFGPLNAERLPAYHRLDVRATRTFRLRRGTLEVFADLFNVYDRRNRASYHYSARYHGDGEVTTVRTSGGEEMLPFLPMVGLRYRF